MILPIQTNENLCLIHTFLRVTRKIHFVLPSVSNMGVANVSEAANWGINWFIEVKGGASAFLGSPIGCRDVFDRVKPALQVGLGKWFTPAIGGRIGFQ